MANPQTSLTLLHRLRNQPQDPDGWQEFVNCYGPLVSSWCRRWGLQPTDADDVTQEVMISLAKQMAEFEYDPTGRFRSWLKTIARRGWCDFLARRSKNRELQATEIANLVHSEDASADLFRRLDAELEKQLYEAAAANIRLRVNPKTWQAFDMTARQGKKGKDVADSLGMAVATVYVARSKVTKLIQQEIRRLDGGSESLP